MANEKELKLAETVFKTLTGFLDEMTLKYTVDEKKDFTLSFTMQGDDIPMMFVVSVDADRQIVTVMSPLPFEFEESKRLEGAIVTSHVNYRLVDGSFDYDFTDGSVFYRMTTSYRDSLISKDVFVYLIHLSVEMVDEFNDKFLFVSKGMMSVEDFINKY